MSSMNEALARYYTRAAEMGLTFDAADAIRRDAQRLHTIAEKECNGTLERIEETGRVDHRGHELKVGKVYTVWGQDRPGPIMYAITRDMETPARARIDAMASAVGAVVEYQGDPRGWPVKLTKGDIETWPPVRG
jgi:hypothetical protein